MATWCASTGSRRRGPVPSAERRFRAAGAASSRGRLPRVRSCRGPGTYGCIDTRSSAFYTDRRPSKIRQRYVISMPNQRRKAPGSPQSPRVDNGGQNGRDTASDLPPASNPASQPSGASSSAPATATAAAPAPPAGADGNKQNRLNITDLKDKSIHELTQIAKDLN